MQAILNSYREQLPTEIAGVTVVRVEDYLTGVATRSDGHTETILLPKENVLKFILEDHSWVTIRPSGTEPKCKFYFGVVKPSKAQADKAINRLKGYFA
ncbi:hypothetical protein [Lysinibacillus sp. LZ02]|uniref:hypothetical protein n=1 Tax=Lysinibacillus sp. LZ02 TaxID=3420668 RepID=UPI003D35BB09